MLLDEPTSNLDAKSMDALIRILQILRAGGMTIIIAEHRLWFLRDVADRVIRLHRGKIVEDLPASQFWLRDDALRHQQGLRVLSRPGTTLLPEPRAETEGISYCHPGERTLHFPRGHITALCGENGVGEKYVGQQIGRAGKHSR